MGADISEKGRSSRQHSTWINMQKTVSQIKLNERQVFSTALDVDKYAKDCIPNKVK